MQLIKEGPRLTLLVYGFIYFLLLMYVYMYVCIIKIIIMLLAFRIPVIQYT